MDASRILSLDLLRAVAVLLVLGRHVVVIPKIGQPPAEWFQVFYLWKRIGWVGVDLFFVLSGFLVSGLLFKEYQKHRSISVKNFLIRRGLKIYPLFYLLLIVTYVVMNGILDKNAPWILFAREGLFYQNYLFGIWGHTWSLAVEEHFYLLLILLCFGLVKLFSRTENPFIWLVPIYLIVAASCLVGRVYLANHYPFGGFTFVSPTHLRIDSLLLGTIVSYFYHFHRARMDALITGRSLYLMLLGCVLLFPAILFELEATPWVYTYGFTLYAYGSACLLLGMLYTKLPNMLPLRLIGGIGVYSYSIYLWHMPVAYWVTSLIRWLAGPEWDSWFTFEVLVAIYFIGSIGLGILISRLVEWPILRLRDRLVPSRTS
jgi:peptidoglycan/LPS O-acetylase OafA/YrhL